MMRKINFSLVLKLAIASLVVGAVLTMIDFRPLEFWRGVIEFLVEGVQMIFGRGLEGLQRLVQYTVMGAAVVVPIWAFFALFSRRGKSKKPVEAEAEKPAA